MGPAPSEPTLYLPGFRGIAFHHVCCNVFSVSLGEIDVYDEYMNGGIILI